MQETSKHLFKSLFEPESIALFGASDTPIKWGFTVLLHILQGGYKGRIYPINPKRDCVMGLPCHKSLDDIEEVPDLAVLVVPARRLFDAMESVIAKGIKAVSVITSGLAEAGEDGKAMEQKLVKMAHDAGIRFVGPNSMGLFSAYPSRLTSIMANVMPEPGPVAVVSQSGNMIVSIIGALASRGVGISRAVSVGNMGSLTIADYINMLADDDKTKIISVYLEGADDGRYLLESAEKASRKKPVVLIKGGRSSKGQQAAKSHTAALSGSYDTFKYAMQEVGVHVADTMDELVNMIGAFNTQPLPKGNRVGALTLGGGWGVLASDMCDKYGLEMPQLPKEIIEELNKDLPEYWSKANPIDTAASTDFMVLPKILKLLLQSDSFDSVLYLGTGYLAHFGHSLRQNSGIRKELGEIGEQILAAEKMQAGMLMDNRDKITKPLICQADLTMRHPDYEGNVIPYLERNCIFVHNSADQAAQAIAGLLGRKRYLDRLENIKEAAPLELNQDKLDAARAIIAEAQKRPNLALSEHESKKLLEVVGVEFPSELEVDSIDAAVEAAEDIGYPVVLKISNPEILHKSDAGGVVLNLMDAEGVRKHAEKLLAHGKLIVVQMACSPQVELLIGLKQDHTFGPTLVFGKGGVETNVWNDSVSLPAPVRADQAERMIAGTTVSKIIDAFRGRGPLDKAALVDTLIRISHLPEIFPEIKELDINPLFLYEKGILAVDAAVILKKG